MSMRSEKLHYDFDFIINWILSTLFFSVFYAYGCMKMDGQLSMLLVFDYALMLIMTEMSFFYVYTVVRKASSGFRYSKYVSIASLHIAGALTCLFIFFYKHELIGAEFMAILVLIQLAVGHFLYKKALR